MALMSNRCQSNGNDHLSLLKINVSCYMIKLDFFYLDPLLKKWFPSIQVATLVVSTKLSYVEPG